MRDVPDVRMIPASASRKRGNIPSSSQLLPGTKRAKRASSSSSSSLSTSSSSSSSLSSSPVFSPSLRDRPTGCPTKPVVSFGSTGQLLTPNGTAVEIEHGQCRTIHGTRVRISICEDGFLEVACVRQVSNKLHQFKAAMGDLANELKRRKEDIKALTQDKEVLEKKFSRGDKSVVSDFLNTISMIGCHEKEIEKLEGRPPSVWNTRTQRRRYLRCCSLASSQVCLSSPVLSCGVRALPRSLCRR